MRSLHRSLAPALLAALALATAVTAAIPERDSRLSPATRAAFADEGDSTAHGRAAAGHADGPDAPAVLSSEPASVPEAALEAKLHGPVKVNVRITRSGLVDSVQVMTGDPRLRAGAVASARWWIFAPPPQPTWARITVDVDGREDADPLTPDVLAIAHDAELRGAPWEAIDACVGALQRVGRHPRLRSEWPIRAEAIRLARLAPDRLKVPGALMSACQRARGQQLRTMASADHAAFVQIFDQALLVSPWWADGYQWRAASLLQTGRGFDAMRTLALFRAAAADSGARSLADRAIAGLAAGDTLAVSRLLMHEGVQFNRDEDADH
jgi:TonB family protein